MLSFNKKPTQTHQVAGVEIHSFLDPSNSENIDWQTVESFGNEWEKFDSFSKNEIQQLGDDYFDLCDDSILNSKMVALDVGCGTGRWTKYVAQRVARVEAVDPSKAVFSAARLLADQPNVRISQADVDNLPFEKGSFDFVFSLGVLHHIPDTAAAMRRCVEMLRPGGYFLVYLYYDFENQSAVFKLLFHLSNLLRRLVAALPKFLKQPVCDLLAVVAYLPFVALAKLVKALGGSELYKKVPLFWYHDKSWNVIRNDALDRFGTPLEQRFSRADIRRMMENCGLQNIQFSDNAPYWHAIGRK